MSQVAPQAADYECQAAQAPVQLIAPGHSSIFCSLQELDTMQSTSLLKKHSTVPSDPTH